MDELISAIADSIPKINDYLVRGFMKKSVNNAHKVVDVIYSEAVKPNSGAISYIGYKILGPFERVKFELTSATGQRRPRISMTRSELQLVRYEFDHEGKRYYTYLYTPYICEDLMIIRDKRLMIHLCIVEKVFSRVNTKNHDGVMVRPIRMMILFNRMQLFALNSTKEKYGSEFIVTVGLHHKSTQGRRSYDTTVLLYLLCKFGLKQTLEMFGVDPKMVSFVPFPDDVDEKHAYFYCKKKQKAQDLFMKVDKSLLEIALYRKLIANLLYTISNFDFQTIESLNDPTGTVYRVMLGRILYRDTNLGQAKSNADSHIISVDTMLDPITIDRFNKFGVHVSNVYDLLRYTFIEIDQLMVNSSSQDLYNKRVDVAEGILIAAFATPIWNRFYKTHQRTQLRPREVSTLLRPRPMQIETVSSSIKRPIRNVASASQIYGDNWLFSCGLQKIRVSADAEGRADPSETLVESVTAFVGSTVGQGGLINPFLPIGPDGEIIRPDYAEDIELLRKYLP